MSKFVVLLIVLFACSACQNQLPEAQAPSTDLQVEEKLVVLAECGVDGESLKQKFALDYLSFDQDPEAGWRPVAQAQECFPAAAFLIEMYLQENLFLLKDQKRMLFVHAGQNYASASQYKRSIPWLKKSMHPSDEDLYGHNLAWNLYMEATIAFLEKDLQSLQRARDELAKIKPTNEEVKMVQRMMIARPEYDYPEGYEYEPQNLGFVDGFIKCFDAPFLKAYGGNC